VFGGIIILFALINMRLIIVDTPPIVEEENLPQQSELHTIGERETTC